VPSRPTDKRRFAAVVLLVTMLLGVGASAAPAEPELRRLLGVAVRPTDAFALTDDGLLLVHSAETRTLTAYSSADGRERWRTAATEDAYQIRSSGGLVLLRPRTFGGPDPGTVALASRTGAVRWRHTGSVVSVAGSPTVLAVSELRSALGSGRRVEGPLVGVDPMTGQTRWTVPVPSTAVLQELPGGRPRVLIVHDDGLAEIRDLDTGRRTASTRFPPADYAPGNPSINGTAVVLRHPGPAGAEVTAFDAANLRQRWRTAAGQAYQVRPCGRLTCLLSRFGVRAVDPSDGTPRWSTTTWRTVEQRGGMLLASGPTTGSADLVGIVDSETGRVTSGLRSWRPVPGQGAADHVLVVRDRAAAGPVVAVAVADTDRPRLIGDLPAGAGDCRTVPGRLVCRAESGKLVLWSYPNAGAREH
jgi:outer membrane protein assembly factor BamB